MFQAISLAVIAALTVIDRLTKYAAVTYVKPNGPFKFLFGLFQLRHVENTVLLTVFTVLILIVCLVLLMIRRIKPVFPNICLVLIVAGGLGNVIDRVLYGYVIDFIEPLFMDFAVFNFADCCITVGAFMLIGYEIYGLIRDKSSKKDHNDAEH